MKSLYSAAILFLMFASCSPTSPNTNQIGEFRDVTWRLYQYSDSSRTIVQVPDSEHFLFSMVSTADSIWGLSNCNTFDGYYLLMGDHFVDTPITTLMGCPLTEDFEIAIENATVLAADSASLELQNDDLVHPSAMRQLWFHRLN